MLTVISKNNCPKCKMTKKFLNANHIQYEEHNINQEPEYIDKMHQLGISSAPVIMNGNDIFTGFNIVKLHRLAHELKQPNQTPATNNQLNISQD